MVFLALSVILVGCSTTESGEPDTIVIFDDNNAVTFASKKYNPELADQDEFKKDEIRRQAALERRRRELGISERDFVRYSRDGANLDPNSLSTWEEYQMWKEFEEFRRWKESQAPRSPSR